MSARIPGRSTVYRVLIVAGVVGAAVLLAAGGYLVSELVHTNDRLATTERTLATTQAELATTGGTLAATQAELATTEGTLVATQAELATTEGTLATTQAELTTTEGTLVATQAELATTGGTLAATQAELSTTEGTLATTQAELATTEGTLATTQAELSTTEGTLAATQAELSTTEGTLAATQAELATTEGTLATTQAELATTEGTLATTQAELTTTQGALATTQAELTTTQRAFNALRETAGTAEELEQRVSDLNQEIARLLEQRRPLILSSSAVSSPGGFTCTGSMEPRLTCLDTATWLHDYRPEDIVVGATISFTRGACPAFAHRDGYIAHRVAAIREDGGVYYFWPKGDANDRPDDCWVPHTAVRGYIIEVHKGTRPENAELRSSVNQAKDDYYAGRNAYSDLRERHGCPRDLSRTCVASGAAFDALLQSFRNVERLREAWSCWLDVARDAQYPPGRSERIAGQRCEAMGAGLSDLSPTTKPSSPAAARELPRAALPPVSVLAEG